MEIKILIYLSLFIFVQLIVFKMTPSEAKTFKHTVKCKLNDADKFTQVWKLKVLFFLINKNIDAQNFESLMRKV